MDNVLELKVQYSLVIDAEQLDFIQDCAMRKEFLLRRLTGKDTGEVEKRRLSMVSLISKTDLAARAAK